MTCGESQGGIRGPRRPVSPRRSASCSHRRRPEVDGGGAAEGSELQGQSGSEIDDGAGSSLYQVLLSDQGAVPRGCNL